MKTHFVTYIEDNAQGLSAKLAEGTSYFSASLVFISHDLSNLEVTHIDYNTGSAVLIVRQKRNVSSLYICVGVAVRIWFNLAAYGMHTDLGLWIRSGGTKLTEEQETKFVLLIHEIATNSDTLEEMLIKFNTRLLEIGTVREAKYEPTTHEQTA